MPKQSRRSQLEAMLQENPGDAFLEYGLAVEYLNEGDVDGGVSRLRRLLETSPDYCAAYFRAGQALAWMWSEVGESLMAALRAHPGVARQVKDLEAEVQAGALTPTAAAERLLRVFRGEPAED